MSEFTKMPNGGTSEKRNYLIELLTKARASEHNQITIGEIRSAYGIQKVKGPFRKRVFIQRSHKNVNLDGPETNRREARLAKKLAKLKLRLPDGTMLQLLDYELPLKSVRADKVGKIDLVGVKGQSLALIELKIKDSLENPRIALLEVLTYGAVVSHPDNLEKITREIEKHWPLRLSEGIHHIILAPQEYWDRWRNEKRRRKRWEHFRRLCKDLLDDGPCAIQCLAFDQDLGSKPIVDVHPVVD